MTKGKNMNAKGLKISAVLSLLLAFAPLPVFAQQESGVEGAFVTADDPITGIVYDTLACATVVIPAGAIWHCAATCSVEANNPAGGVTDMDYLLAITRAGAVVGGSQRGFDFDDNAGVDDTNNLVVSTTGTAKNISGTNTLCCAARKLTAADPDMTIDNSSISLFCSDFLL
jgi:hypothetical protein